MELQEYIPLVMGAIFVNNIVLTRFLGICPFLGVSKRLGPACGMSMAVLFVMTLAALVTSGIQTYILRPEAALVPQDLTFLKTIVFILVIASLVQLVELTLQRFSPPLYNALGIYLPLITTNCAIMGTALLAVQNGLGVVPSVVFGLASAVGFALALILFSSLRERLELAQPPEWMEGVALSFVTAGILAMAFMGFSGMGM